MLFNHYPLNGELDFVIEDAHKRKYPLRKAIVPRELRDSDLTVLRSGQTMEQVANLTDLYGLSKRGTYRVQVIYYNRADLEKNGLKTWRGAIASEPTQITLN